MQYHDLVSVIMSVYNEEVVYLDKAVKSILNQTYRNFEFIIVIDNPNNLEAINYLKQQQVQDSRILLLENEQNIGLASSLNRALTYCKGDIIFRMDSDDTCTLDRFERQLQLMEKDQLDIVCGYYMKIDSNDQILSKGKIYQNLNDKRLKKILNYRNIMPHSCWCVKKEVYEVLAGYQQLVPAEDYDFLLRARAKGFKMGMIEDYLLCYRLSEQGISRTGAYRQYVLAEILTNYHKGKIKANIYDKNELEKIYQYYYDNCYTDQDFFEFHELKLKMFKNKFNLSNYLALFKKKAYLKLFKRDLVTLIMLRVL